MVAEGRVAWREGLFLRQQHFQQQDRHADAQSRLRSRWSGPYAWGVTELVVNESLAALGKFGIERLSGILPDGLPFSIPGDLPPPAPLDVPAGVKDAIIYLTVPAHQPGAVEYRTAGEAGAADSRFVVDLVEVPDTFSEDRMSEPVEVARPNLSLGITREQTYGRVLLGLARVRETSGRALMLDDRYLMPALDVRASRRLAGFLTDIIGRAEQRIEELALRAAEAGEGGADAISDFLLLQALNRWRPQLLHLSTLPAVHPERLFGMLLGMAGDLAAPTSSERRLPEFPAYDHEAMQNCFEPLVEYLQSALSAIYDRAAVLMPLVEAAPGAYTARIPGSPLYQTGYFFLGVRARASMDDVRSRFPSMAKLGPVQRMRQIVESALPGIGLRQVPTPPPQIRSLPGHVYFELDRSSPDWPELMKAPALGLHVAGDWADLALELWCVRQGRR